MDTRKTRYWLSAMLLTSIIVVDATSNDTSSEPREPRVTGRIVKVYSGIRPEPFFCSSEGFKADPVNCAVFYRCVSERSGKYTVFRYQCAPGTVYDQDLETCNHPRNTRRSECGGLMKPDVTTVSPDYSNEIEKDHKEIPHPISTSAPAFTEKTTRANIVTSQFTNKFNTPTVSAFTTVYPWSSSTTRQTDSTKYWSENSTTKKLPATSQSGDRTEICFSDGFVGDFDNCRKFYRCVGNQRGGFMRYEFYCSESTVWDDELQSCNHPWAVKRSKCGRSLSDNSLSRVELEQATTNSNDFGYKSVQEQLQISHGTKVTQTQTQINHGNNVKQNQTQINYGDPVNSDKNSETKQNQTQISHGSAVSQTQTQIDYGNKGMQTQLQIDHSKNSSQSQTQIHESTTKQSTSTQHGSQQGTNDNQCSENGFMGDSNNCKKFYRCVDNGRGSFTKYEYQCGEGTVWDPTIESCNHAWAVKGCGGHISTESNKEQTTTTMTKSTSHASSTTQNYYTTTTTDSNIEDIDEGYGNQGPSEDKTSSTSTTTSTTTEKTNSDRTECTSSGFISDTNDCRIFYRCVDNGKGFTKHEFKCGDGTVWDPEIEACNHAWAVNKCGGSSSSHKEETTTKQTTLGVQTTIILVQTTTQPPTLNEEYDSSYGPPAETPSTTITTTSNPLEQNDDCTSSGFVGDSKNCKKFYRCVDNGNGGFTKHEFTCGEGTVWDSKIEACNHAWAVENCSSSGNHQQTTQASLNTKEPSSSYTTTDRNTENPAITSTSSSTVHLTTEPSSGSECNKSGFMGAKNNCKIFYRCVDNGDGTYTRYEFTCGEGTVWDPKIEACNHAWAVEECGGSNYVSGQSTSTSSSTSLSENQELTEGTTEQTSLTTTKQDNEISNEECIKEGFFGNKNNCNKFYRCVDDGKGGFVKYDFSCGAGTVWNDNIQACDHASADGTCRSEVSLSTNQPQYVNDEIDSETTTKGSSSSSYPHTQSTQNPSSPENAKCESEGFYGDPSDCKKFYRCVDDGKGGYTKFNFVCGEGTTWNQEIKACDHESDDKTCLSSSSTSAGSSSTSESPQNKPTSTSSTTEKENDESINQVNSDEKCSSEGFFSHSKDCMKFIRCVSDGNGQFIKYEFSCGQGTVWVQEIQACDHDDGNCKNQNPSSSTNQETTEGTSTSSSSTVESQTPSKENDEYESSNMPPQNDESDECTSEGYYGNSKDCRKFYRCVDNGNGVYTKYDFMCGEGTAWDSNIQTCNHFDQVETCSDNNNEETQTQQTPKDDQQQSQTTESGASTTKGPSESSQSSSKDVCEEEGYYGDSQDCKKFYRCVDNGKGGYTKYDFVCGEGTIWDQDITNCNHPQDVSNPSCTSNQGESSTSSSSGSGTTTSSSQSTSSTTEGSGTSSNCSSEKPAGNKNVTCDKAGYYPDPNDCKKFYRCVDWDGDGKRFSVYHFECGEGTIWDPALDTCNHEESVYPPRDCSSQSQTQSPSETTTQQSTTEESTTTEQSTTQESTTTEQSTTSEQTTTQQSTTSEQTTTQQSTTSEQTTTQQSTTSEQTTTQQSTTSEQTTTQQSTTSEQTTTQQTTTSEQTTTQQSTTSEQTTTEQSTTSESSTTQESTTSEQSTTQESTTSEQTTTQESTTTEQITESTTEQTEGTTESTTDSTETTTTEESSTTTESEQESTTEDSSSSNNECPETDDDQYLLVCPTSFRRHPKYCNMFYQCEEDEDTHEVKIAMFKCPNETIYDESQTQCVEEKKADKKCEGEMARKQRFKRLSNKEPIVVDKEKKSCPNVGYFAFEKQYECSPAFLRCEKLKSGELRGLVNQCPKGYIFWSISKRCEKVQNVKDCKRSSNDWTDRWNIPTERKNIAV